MNNLLFLLCEWKKHIFDFQQQPIKSFMKPQTNDIFSYYMYIAYDSNLSFFFLIWGVN